MMSGPDVPLFSQSELADAFALLAPPDEAAKLAAQWFDEMAGQLDAEGRCLCPGGWGDEIPLAPNEEPSEPTRPHAGYVEDASVDAKLFSGLEPGELSDLLIRLGDLHLALVALLDDERYEWMRRVRRMSHAGAARNRRQLQRGIAAWRERWLEPDGQSWIQR